MSDSSEHPLPNLDIRVATANDIPEILRQRRAMYEDMGYRDADALAAMVSLSAGYLSKSLDDGSFRACLASVGNRVAAGGAIIISPWPAHPYDLECRRATILNVYTYPEYRRRGVARRLMQTMIDWCKREDFARVTLHASKDGRSVYEALGFEIGNEMVLKLP
ncbi:MAG: GNAT family N-acetyltransferase [Candidatus Sulfotelmatobacter sp.]